MFLISGLGIALSVILPILGIALIVGVVFLVIFLKRKLIFDSALKKFDDSNQLLASDCSKMLTRLNFLGESNELYRLNYENKKTDYDNFRNNRRLYVKSLIEETNNLKNSKQKKEYLEKKKELVDASNTFYSDVLAFHDSLTLLLKEDSDAIEYSIPLKEKYRSISEFYEKNIDSLKYIEKSFRVFFNEIQKTFDKNENLVNQTKYEEAKECLDSISPFVSDVEKIISSLPSFCLSIFIVIPDSLQETTDLYNHLLDEKYYLKDLNIDQVLHTQQESLDRLKNKIKHFDTKNIAPTIDIIKSALQTVNMQLNNEIEAKRKFLTLQEEINKDSNFDIEKRYSKLTNSLPDYQKYYVIDNKYIEQISDLKFDIENISSIKHELDSYITASERNLYTVILEKTYQMLNEIEKINKTINEHERYLVSLKEDANQLFKQIRLDYLDLEELLLTIKKTHVAKYISYKEQTIYKIEEQIINLNQILTNAPIDVYKAKLLYAEIIKLLKDVKTTTSEEFESFNKASLNITKSNTLILDFTDSREPINNAVDSFNNGDFNSANTLCLEVLSKFNSASLNEATNSK